MKRKVMIILALILGTTFLAGIAYSAFFSSATLNVSDQKIAKFIFNAKTSEKIELPLVDIKPNMKEEYLFSVTNSEEEKISNVTINYQISIKTFHFIPLNIKLYKENEKEPKLVCDESYSRNEDNILVCSSSLQELKHNSKKLDNYKLEIEFPNEYNESDYADLVDFMDIEIKSWQKKEK